MENTIAVANFFVGKALDENVELTPLKLIKLVYISHGWHLGYRSAPLISEPVEAWPYGPVVPTVYQYFKKYGKSQITQPSSQYTEDGSLINPVITDGGFTTNLLERVWNVYKKFNGIQLSSLTHAPDTPWFKTTGGGAVFGIPIPNPVIEQHYKEKLAKNGNAGSHAES